MGRLAGHALGVGAVVVWCAACGSSTSHDGGTAGHAGMATSGGTAGTGSGAGGSGGAGAARGGTTGGATAGKSGTAGGSTTGKGGTAGGAGAARGGSAGGATSADGGAAGDGPEGPAVDGFCAAWLDAFAGFMERCACDPSAIAKYRDTNGSLCEPGGFLAELPAEVAAGDFSYDAGAAAALLARLASDDAPCVDESFRALRLDSEELYSLGGVFIGTHELGEACAHPVGFKGGISDCRTGYCASDGADAGVCIAFVAEGEPCDGAGSGSFDADVPRLCHVRRGPDADGEYASSFDVFACVTPPGGGPAVCTTELPDGSPCQTRDVCNSGLCFSPTGDMGTCTAKLPDGEPCLDHGECASGACGLDEPRVCGGTFTDGTLCDYDNSACTSGYCDAVADAAPVCLPVPSRAIGEDCTLSVECISEGHGGSRDGVCHNGVCVNDLCAGYNP